MMWISMEVMEFSSVYTEETNVFWARFSIPRKLSFVMGLLTFLNMRDRVPETLWFPSPNACLINYFHGILSNWIAYSNVSWTRFLTSRKLSFVMGLLTFLNMRNRVPETLWFPSPNACLIDHFHEILSIWTAHSNVFRTHFQRYGKYMETNGFRIAGGRPTSLRIVSDLVLVSALDLDPV